jgi:hypothetical protein
MPVAVDGYLVPAGEDLLWPARISGYLFTDDEERSSRAVLFQYLQERIEPAIRPVVEGQRYGIVRPELRYGRKEDSSWREQGARGRRVGG